MGPGPLGGGMNSSSDNCHPMVESVAKLGIAASFAAPRASAGGQNAPAEMSAASMLPTSSPDSMRWFPIIGIFLIVFARSKIGFVRCRRRHETGQIEDVIVVFCAVLFRQRPAPFGTSIMLRSEE